MKIIVTHMRPDLDAVGAVFAIKRFLPGWENAKVKFVPAGERLSILSSRPSERSQRVEESYSSKAVMRPARNATHTVAGGDSSIRLRRTRNDNEGEVVEKIGNDEVIHVDTGLGPLDHHQTAQEDTCAAKRAWEFVKSQIATLRLRLGHDRKPARPAGGSQNVEMAAGDRLMDVICDIDHFKEVTWPDPASDRYDITVSRILDGLKLMEREDDEKIIEVGLLMMNALYHAFQNKVWAEHELSTKGVKFQTRWGKGIAVETLNDDVVHLAQRMGYLIALRKDPRKGYVRIKASPLSTINPFDKLRAGNRPIRQAQGRQSTHSTSSGQAINIDLTPAYKKLKALDTNATWFLHVSKRMLLNGTTKNPTMRPTRLTLAEIVEVLKKI